MSPSPDPFDVVTFLSDFGRRDIFVGVCHGVIAAAAPHVRIIDLTHEVEPHDVGQGAVLLARAVEHLPSSVHLAVVDPGVGTARRGVAVVTARGDVLIGPDNGLLLPAADVLGGVAAASDLSDAPRRGEVSATFHGRDVFAPAAAAVASGADPAALGAPVDDLVAMDLPGPDVDTDARRLRAPVLLIDRFGNLQLAAPGRVLDEVGLRPGEPVEVVVDATPHAAHVATRHAGRIVRTFGELAPGELGVYQDSDRQVAVAVNGGSAAQRTAAARGARLTVHPAGLADPSGG